MDGITKTKELSNKVDENIFEGKRILVCGKGGCGKSSIVTLIGMVLEEMGKSVVMLDGDASNPGGLCRLLFGAAKNPKPLMDFFGGREHVECPVDNPAPLTRINETIAITDKNIELLEIPPEYIIENKGIKLLQVGKIENAFEGCDGPMSKISRDFIINGSQVTLLDVEAGIEHFGRGLEQNVDIILVIVDPTYESLILAEKVNLFSEQMGNNRVWVILNKARTKEIELKLRSELKEREINILGTVNYDPEIEFSGLMGTKLEKSEAFYIINDLIKKLADIYQNV